MTSFGERLVFSGEYIISLKSIGRIVGTKDLSLLALPFGLVDSINVILDFHHDATILLNGTATAVKSLSGLNRQRSFIIISKENLRNDG